MNWFAYIYGVIGALAVIEVYYALKTKEVAWPLFGMRRRKAASPVIFWALIAFWTLLLVASVYAAGAL